MKIGILFLLVFVMCGYASAMDDPNGGDRRTSQGGQHPIPPYEEDLGLGDILTLMRLRALLAPPQPRVFVIREVVIETVYVPAPPEQVINLHVTLGELDQVPERLAALWAQMGYRN